MEASPEVEPLRHLDGILRDDEVHVWQVDLIAWEKEAGSLLDLLDGEEQERAARFKFPGPRTQFVISRAMLRRALGRYLGIDGLEVRFRTTANGKPELAAESGLRSDDLRSDDLRFNLSHTEGATVFAITRHRQVGVDVERIRLDTNAMELAERFFSRPEVQWLRSQPASEQIPAFFGCWTGKEAYIKAHGEGLSMPLSSFGVLPTLATDGFELQLKVYETPEEGRRWSIWRLELGPGLRAALAVEGEGCRVRLGQWPLPDDSNERRDTRPTHTR
jgi:4'-phosphopantetheinyl transferase